MMLPLLLCVIQQVVVKAIREHHLVVKYQIFRYKNGLIYFFTTNNNTLDTYLDGKLVRTCVLTGTPKMDNKMPVFLTPNNGFSGYTSKFRFYARTLNPREVFDIYKEGYSDNPLGALLGKYKNESCIFARK